MHQLIKPLITYLVSRKKKTTTVSVEIRSIIENWVSPFRPVWTTIQYNTSDFPHILQTHDLKLHVYHNTIITFWIEVKKCADTKYSGQLFFNVTLEVCRWCWIPVVEMFIHGDSELIVTWSAKIQKYNFWSISNVFESREYVVQEFQKWRK